MFVGTINKLRIVDMRVDRVDAIEGETMKVNLSYFLSLSLTRLLNKVEQIIEAVLQGQTKSAPIERTIDVDTAYFPPLLPSQLGLYG